MVVGVVMQAITKICGDLPNLKTCIVWHSDDVTSATLGLCIQLIVCGFVWQRVKHRIKTPGPLVHLFDSIEIASNYKAFRFMGWAKTIFSDTRSGPERHHVTLHPSLHTLWIIGHEIIMAAGTSVLEEYWA